ncbi:hypothetical protein AD998_00485 [bacterium 336/3]|nr:hypothetical protein AD998_00485 [bacterium 336/3]
MKKIFYFTFCTILLAACGSNSKKGAWEAKDKEKYVKNCVDKYSKDDAMKADGTDMNKLCACMAGKAEINYENPSAIDKTAEDKILGECFIIK